MNLDNYDLEYHGDGTFTATPKPDTDEDLLARYATLLNRIAQATDYRDKAEVRRAELEAKRLTAVDVLTSRGLTP